MFNTKHLLLVEDNTQMRDALRELFAGDLGFAVDVAGSTNEALHLLEHGAYDLVFSDNQFPSSAGEAPSKNQGMELLKWMRSEQKYAHTPFILHTADSSSALKEQVEGLNGIFCAKGDLNNFEQILRNALLEHA